MAHSTSEESHTFLENYLQYVKDNIVILPGCIPGLKSANVRVLSSSESKMSVWWVYHSTCEVSNKQGVSYGKFIQLWQDFFPDVVVAKPMTDFCFMCQQNTTKLQHAANLSDIEKSECIAAHQEHLNSAKAERGFYKFVCNISKETLKTHGTKTLLNHGSRTASTLAGPVHYSFEWAQQVHIPSNPIFGIMWGGIPQ